MTKRLLKPKRKHPGIGLIAESPQGQTFLNIISGTLGEGWTYEPYASTKDNTHLFLLTSESARGWLLEASEVAVEGEFVAVYGFLCQPPQGPAIILAQLKTFRWDPWLYAKHSGDESVLQLSGKKRAELRDRRSCELGAAKDYTQMQHVPPEQATDDLLGIPLAVLRRGLSAMAEDDSA